MSKIYFRDLYQGFMSDICQRLYRDLRHLSRSSVCNFIQEDTPTQMTYISEIIPFSQCLLTTNFQKISRKSRAFIQNFYYTFTYSDIRVQFAIFYFTHNMQFQIQAFLAAFFNQKSIQHVSLKSFTN